jgi:hypothetical protein
MQLNHTSKFLPSLLTIGISLTAITQPAQAGFGFLDDINSALRDVNSTIDTVKSTQQNTSVALTNLSNLLGISPSANNNNSTDPTTQVLDIYSKWYTSMNPAHKETVNWLTTQYAEDLPITFAAFIKTPLYESKSEQDRPKIAVTFFKFSEVVKTLGPQKDKFLAFAFCVNSGATNCK